jgi:hypothetical protein
MPWGQDGYRSVTVNLLPFIVGTQQTRLGLAAISIP